MRIASVTVMPGAMALTVMPDVASARAYIRVSAMTANLVIE